jgi:hypothetical protein
MRQTIFCKHYRAMSEHKTCEAGVDYDDFKGIPFRERPCFWTRENHREFDQSMPQPPPGCSLAVFPTEAEIEAEETEDQLRFDRIRKAREAIITSLGGPWKKGMAGSRGEIPCTCDGCDGTIRFIRSGYNGHVHAKCLTAGCVSWME